MFICDRCKQASQPGEPMVRVVVETRAREYPYREEYRRGRGAEFARKWIDPGGVGTEIVREERCHATCAGAAARAATDAAVAV